jgi:hypothetical protein
MPYDFTIDVPLQLVRTRYWGAVTDEDVMGHQQRLLADPLFNRDFHQLVDCRQVTSVKGITGQGMARVASRDMFSDQSRRVMVADQVVLAGLAHMMALYRDSAGGKETIHVVKTLKEALDWLWAAA